MKLDSNDVRIPASSVGVYDAIYRRRSVKEFTNDPVPGETLERLFSAAIWAPNHRLTEPTRFFAVRKDGSLRTKIADIAWQATCDGVASPNPDKKRHSADAKRDRVLNAPALVYLYSLHGENNQMTLENYATSCCAVQNRALAAATVWGLRTTPYRVPPATATTVEESHPTIQMTRNAGCFFA